ncbi:hypothetical protein [Acidovorax sp.]|uniref:hypothetical protein n=1 Tax=Acidovorax sp. TaxID=1872122 RepID=UPI0027BAD326|nr:hypothetical protein [Acidovorax sp.]
MAVAPVPALAGVTNPVALVMVMGLMGLELAAVAMAPVHRAAVALVPELVPELVQARALALAPVPVPVLAQVKAPASIRPTLAAQVLALVVAVSCLRL